MELSASFLLSMFSQNEYDSRDHHNVLDPQIEASLRTSPVEVILTRLIFRHFQILSRFFSIHAAV